MGIDEMLGQLKVVKDRLVSVRRDVPEKLKTLKQLLPHVESLENGISDLSQWLDEGERILAGHGAQPGKAGTVNERLDMHKVGALQKFTGVSEF